MDLIKANPEITRKELAVTLGNITENGVKYHLMKLKKDKHISRAGADKGGYWKLLENKKRLK